MERIARRKRNKIAAAVTRRGYFYGAKRLAQMLLRGGLNFLFVVSDKFRNFALHCYIFAIKNKLLCLN
jgi:hypothetical protein